MYQSQVFWIFKKELNGTPGITIKGNQEEHQHLSLLILQNPFWIDFMLTGLIMKRPINKKNTMIA